MTGGDGADTFVIKPDTHAGSGSPPSGDVDWVQWRSEDGGNDHWYGVVLGQIRWTDAKAAAEGFGGHLATITSAPEDAFVLGLLEPPGGIWLGGFQPKGSPEPDGNWQWVTGEPFDYTNWSPGEPNEGLPEENYLQATFETPDAWNDGPNDFDRGNGYVVEHVGFPGSAGLDIITDFAPGEDRLNLRAFGFADLDTVAELMRQQGSDVLVDLSQAGGRDVLLLNTNLLDMTAADFLL
jgi:Ca2+-binding RTX toxin-like protein